MRLALFALIAAVAAPATAQQVPPALPFAPRGATYVETHCTGGIAGIDEWVRILANGEVLRATRYPSEIQRSRATPGEVARIWRALDFARFESRAAPPEQPYVMDGIDCSLTRVTRGRGHTVTLLQQMRGKPKYRDLSEVIQSVNALGKRATGPILRPAKD